MSTAKDNRFYREATTSAERRVQIDYTNHAGVRQIRQIVPVGSGIRFDISQWHPERQWLLDAYDVGKDDMRTFAVKDIHWWQPIGSKSARVDASIAKQLQRSMELNARMKSRLNRVQEYLSGAVSNGGVFNVEVAIKAILKDEDPT